MTSLPILTCPGSLLWAEEVVARADGADGLCHFCGAALALSPGDRSATLPAHDAADKDLPIAADTLPILIAEAQEDVEVRDDPAERDVRNRVLARLIGMYDRAIGIGHTHAWVSLGDTEVCPDCGARWPGTCLDPDHGIGDHPCDEVLGRGRGTAARAL